MTISISGVLISIDGQSYLSVITELPAKDKRPKRYEIEIPEGISISDFDQYGDNLLYAWCFPANTMAEAIDIFVEKVKAEREKNK